MLILSNQLKVIRLAVVVSIVNAGNVVVGLFNTAEQGKATGLTTGY